MPAAASLRIRVAVYGAMRLRQAAEPPLATSPTISTRSLDRNWNAVQRADSFAGANRLLRRFSGQPRIGSVDRDESVQPGLQPLDASKAFLHQVDRRQASRSNLRGQYMGGTKGSGGHGTFSCKRH